MTEYVQSPDAGSTERLYFNPPTVASSWWSRYSAALHGLTDTARAALQVDSQYVVEKGIFGAGAPGPETWRQGKTRTGLVMGSVQSGKTASMFGVTALALDLGVDVVVVLAGTRLSLWKQTYERLSDQLDAGDDTAEKATRRLLCPAPGLVLSGGATSLQDTYRLSSAQIRRKLSGHRPLVVVAMKQTDHLYALGNSLRSSLFDAVDALTRPVHMLVLDDEADDGSVLDAAVEAGLDPLSPGLKQVPRAIADLWEPRSRVAPANLYTTYVGYTATPQANLLQEDHNPLAPRDFVISLRTPLDIGDPVQPEQPDAPKSSTYPEPTGLDHFYTGGSVYYERGASAGLSVELSDSSDEDLADSVRAFLVAGAIRLHRGTTPSGPYSIADLTFATLEDALTASPKPHSMLFHPAADIGRHFEGAEDVLIWAGVEDRAEARQILESGTARLPHSLVVRMLQEEPLWAAWADRYRASWTAISTEFNVTKPRVFPTWPEIRHLLETEVIPGTRVSVVNSDDKADDRPEYVPRYDESTGRWLSARDLSTIFVAGNVMARGLTLEGMTTALFRRGASTPLADTQMQMQRWFGYRGEYIELCRVFASQQQLALFGAYHDLDEALRQSISARMDGTAPTPVVLHGLGFLATGKIANLRRLPLCPSSRPFVTLINDGRTQDPNERVVADLFADRASSDVVVKNELKGRALDDSLSLVEAAELLDRFEYGSYAPGLDTELGRLWREVQARVSATVPLPISTQFYNAPDSRSGESSPARLDCPYAVAAYLRLWNACLTRPVRGFFVTGEPTSRWAMSDLQLRQANQPRFNVGIRFGSGNILADGPLGGLSFDTYATRKRIGNSGEMETTWGANDPGAGQDDYRGDIFFDYYHRKQTVPLLGSGNPWRPTGSDGQILFYVNQIAEQSFPTVAIGICIPGGGPEQFAATRAGSMATARAEIV